MQLFFQCIQIFLQSNLHPYESRTRHNTGSQYDEQKQGVAHVAALRVAPSVKRRNTFIYTFQNYRAFFIINEDIFRRVHAMTWELRWLLRNTSVSIYIYRLLRHHHIIIMHNVVLIISNLADIRLQKNHLLSEQDISFFNLSTDEEKID